MEDRILLAHGSGGRLSRDLVDREIVPRFGAGTSGTLTDGAAWKFKTTDLIFSTDSFVVQPLFFPGGCIGDLAVHGSVNDVAVSGGKAICLSLGLILEEGLELTELRRVLDAVRERAGACGVRIITGDTKVVQRGKCDGIYINTSAIGEKLPELELAPGRISAGDVVLTNGTLGDHGMAVLAAREKLLQTGDPISDTASVQQLVLDAAEFGAAVKFMRDPTRGGAAAVLNEIMADTELGAELWEQELPFTPAARALAEMVGMDLLQVASEGRVLLFCSREAAPGIVRKWQSRPEGRGAKVIGEITQDRKQVLLKTLSGGRRFIDVPEGELLPRIC